MVKRRATVFVNGSTTFGKVIAIPRKWVELLEKATTVLDLPTAATRIVSEAKEMFEFFKRNRFISFASSMHMVASWMTLNWFKTTTFCTSVKVASFVSPAPPT